jgi:hypothetical protein
MIRIDEIYYNTFLPVIQERPYHCIHWFDPFGSVRFEDLCSAPAISAAMPHNIKLPNNDVVRYLFWDQEPLHKDTVEKTLSKYHQLFHTNCDPTTHFISSEHDSEMVDYVKNTYGFIPHYYFFHGWAALDWFRGYNRSFLITPTDQRKIKKTFLCPNRIVAGRREHRLLMLYHVFKNGLEHNWISCPEVCPAENVTVTQAIKSLTATYPDIEQVFARQSFPMYFPNENKHSVDNSTSARLDLFDRSAESLLYLISETVATGRRQHLTEKTFKPICMCMPFIMVSCMGSLEYLRSYGFKTFGTLWDESYDDESNDIHRYEKISNLLQDLDSLSMKEKQQLFDSAIDICQHNYDHFYGGGFERILWHELTGMIHEF